MRALVLLLSLFALPELVHAAPKKAVNYGVLKTSMGDVNLWEGPGRDEYDTQMRVKRYEEVYVTGPAKRLENGEKWVPVRLRRKNPDGSFSSPRGWVDSKFFHRAEDSVEEDQPEGGVRGTCAHCHNHNQPGKLPGGTPSASHSSKGFIWPVTGRFSSGFGYRFHPMLGETRLHKGIDINGNNRRPVVAAKAGRIRISRGGCSEHNETCNHRAGNWIEIVHGNGLSTNYMHLSPTCKLPPEGTWVAQGEKIGCVGKSGGATGPHLHFGVKLNNRDVDPMQYLPRNH